MNKGFIQIPLALIIISSIVIASLGAGFVLQKQGKLNQISASILNVFSGKETKSAEDQPIEKTLPDLTQSTSTNSVVITNNAPTQEPTPAIYNETITEDQLSSSPSPSPVWLPTPTPSPSPTPSSSPSLTPTPSPTPSPSISPTPTQQTPTYMMPDKPIIESFCDDKENCVCSSFAEPNSSCSASSNTTVHVGETLNFTIKVSGEETSGVLAFILPQEYDWVKEGGIKPWGTDLTYTKTFSTEDVSARYFMYAYIKSSNDNYHRRSSGCNWTSYSCDDNAQIIYTVLP